MKTVAIALCSILLPSFVMAKGSFEYDSQKGWWWYKEIVEQNGKKYEIKTPFSNKEKLQFEQKMKTNELLKKQIKLLAKIQKRLDYAYPDLTPKYGINKKTGEKCLANSSADCFVMPVQPDAQRIPVFKNFLRNPSPENAEKYLQWQAAYFNHVSDVSHGLRFAYLSKGPEAYPTNTTFTYGDNLAFPYSEKISNFRKYNILDQLAPKLGVMIFVGANSAIENATESFRFVYNYMNDVWRKIEIVLVAPSEEAKKNVLERAKQYFGYDPSIERFWKNAQWVTDKRLFEKYNVFITPTVVGFYKKDNGEILWQPLTSGSMSPEKVRDKMIQFLMYNKIIKPQDLATAVNAASIQKNMKVKPVHPEEGKEWESTGKTKKTDGLPKDKE